MDDNSNNLILEAIREQTVVLRQVLEKLNENTSDQNEYLTVKQAAKLLHRTPKTIRNWIASGKLKAIKFGNSSQQDQFYIPRATMVTSFSTTQLPLGRKGVL